MIHNLPDDVLLDVLKHVSLVDVYYLRYVCKMLYNKTRSLSPYYITWHCQTSGTQQSKEDVIDMLSCFLEGMLQQSCSGLIKYLEQKHEKQFVISPEGVSLLIRCLFKDSKREFTVKISEVPLLNNVYYSVFSDYLEIRQNNTSVDLCKYQDMIKLFYMYQLLTICKFKCPYDVNYNVQFISEVAERTCADIAKDYFEYLLERKIVLQIDNLHRISKYVATVGVLKKLFGLRTLDLSKTELIDCCDDCIMHNLTDMAQLKMNLHLDLFLSQNYTSVKRFLNQKNITLLHRLEYVELVLINKLIRFRNPLNGRTMKLTNPSSQRFLYQLKYEYTTPTHQRMSQKLENYIINTQKRLTRRFFT